MSLSSALSNALSGLTASARGANVVSSNLANTLTDGYAVRELSLSARTAGTGGGVMVNGLNRLVDQALVGDRRFADAEQGQASTQSRFLQRLSSLTGDPTEARSLTGLLSEFETSLISAANLPESETRLASVLQSANAIAESLNTISAGVQNLRAEADREINQQVTQLNTALQNVERLNNDILSARSQGREVAGLLDQRQALVDEISSIVPVQELQRDMGVIALMTPGGAILLDGKAADITFEPHNTVVAHMTVEEGLLSGIQVNGFEVSAVGSGAMSGGTLGGLFSVRDEVLTSVQAELDTVALDLIERFETGVDPSLAAGAPGLFTDDGSVAENTTGIAGRIAINALVDPEQGGDLWRLRDGLGATENGNSGNADLLQSMLDVMTDTRVSTSSSLGIAARDLAGLTSDFLSSIGQRENLADKTLSFTSARQFELTEMELALGVDTDAELQKLMLIERAYAANAKIVQAVDEMLQQLMEIG
ncbi:flagellar hook-associated protein FlgK [Thalassovita sp.]|uniref:flagellar hook-associated protein FlgK n=1 Tax=Thalassovita sp. TaxID=1979401 RepID=UPI0028822441|nr:flagellar hook-associated protein FlgK [Thalassovita sp.]MDF1802012.1 flagellar hook-associated protein FlgK [Thalassovita sp.]